MSVYPDPGYRGFLLSREDVLALPLDELALRVLHDAAKSDEWNWRNWMIQAEEGYRRDAQVLGALGEAWEWLFSHGLAARYRPGQSSEGAVMVTRLGRATLSEGLPWLRAHERLDVELVPALERTARLQFLRGDFETAAFVAMKEVEVAVREASGLPGTLLGIKLMQEAFKSNGPLWQEDLDPGKSVATMELFKGAIGLFKNPSSHRRVDFSDATEAAEIVLLADLLLRLLGRTASS